MNPFDKRTIRVLLTILAFVVVLGFFYLASKPLIVFLFAILFAYLLEPIIGKVQQWTHRSRGFAIAVVYFALLLSLIIGGSAAGPRIVNEGRRLGEAAPELYQKITSGNIAWQFGQQRGWSYETQTRIRDFLASHQGYIKEIGSSIGAHAAEVATNVGWLVLVPILAVFFLKDKSHFSQSLQSTMARRQDRSLFREVVADLDEMLSHFVRAQLFLVLISWSVYTAGLTAMRVPYSFVLGAIGGLLEFIPVIGPLTAGAVILAVAFTANYGHVLFVLLFLVVWRIALDYVIAPRVFGGRIELHPLATIFGILVGGEIGGVVGVYLAVPAMAAVRILWLHWRTYEEAARVAGESPEAVLRPR